jgi:hypothetical protein
MSQVDAVGSVLHPRGAELNRARTRATNRIDAAKNLVVMNETTSFGTSPADVDALTAQ